MSYLENRIPPPVVALMLLIAMAGIACLLPQPTVPIGIRLWIAMPVAVAAGFFVVSAFRSFRRAKTTISPVHIERASALVTTGIYRITRNPMYVALLLLLVAIATAFGRIVLLLGPLLFFAYIDRFQIVPEERALSRNFGAAYDEYRRQVRRWL